MEAKPLRIAWILGWSVPVTWWEGRVRALLPDADHRIIPAAPGWEPALRAAGDVAWVVGYSLGAHLLLAARPSVPPGTAVALLAPFFAFPMEEGGGGRIPRAQVSHLGRWLKRDPAAAVADFHRRAGLDIPAADAAGLSGSNLQWGIQVLLESSASREMPQAWKGWCGTDDPLLDAVRLRVLAPALTLLPKAGHAPGPMVAAFAATVK